MHGVAVAKKIRSWVHKLEGHHRQLGARVSELDNTHARLALERQATVQRLAEIYLPELREETVSTVRSHFPRLQKRVDAILLDKHRHREHLEASIAETERLRRDLERELEETTDRIEEKAERRDTLQAEVQQELDRDTAYAERLTATEQARERLQQSRRRLDVANRERDEKIPAYDQNRLFGYLRRRRFETEAYRGRGLTARLDAWVAGRVDYRTQEQSYRILHDVVEVMANEFATAKTALADTVAAQQAIEQEVAEKHGLTQVVQEGDELAGKRAAFVSRLEQLDASFGQLAKDRKQLDDRRGRFYRKALDEYQSFLDGSDVGELRAVARSTSAPSDDGLVARLADFQRQLDDGRKEQRNLKLGQHDLAERLSGFKKIESTFFRQGFDASNSHFDDRFDVDGLLEGYRSGRMSLRRVLRAIEKAQRFVRDRRSQRGMRAVDALTLLGHLASQTGAFGGGRRGGFRGFGGGSSGGFGGGGSRTTGGFG